MHIMNIKPRTQFWSLPSSCFVAELKTSPNFIMKLFGISFESSWHFLPLMILLCNYVKADDLDTAESQASFGYGYGTKVSTLCPKTYTANTSTAQYEIVSLCYLSNFFASMNLVMDFLHFFEFSKLKNAAFRRCIPLKSNFYWK